MKKSKNPRSNILIVEDEAVVAKDLQSILSDLGYKVLAIADTADDAFEKTKKLRPDLVLMDIVLKGDKNGIWAAKKIHEQFNTPIIYLTAYSDEKKMEQSMVSQPYAYILKPFNAKELKIAIEIALYKHQAEMNENAAKEILKISEGKYHSLFDNMREGFAYCKVSCKNGKPNSFVFLAVNSSFEKITGLKNVVGKKSSEVLLELRKSQPDLFNVCCKVALTGKSYRLESYNAISGWLYISIYSPEKGHIVALVEDITEQKTAEKILKESEDRYRNLIDNSTDMIQSVKVDGTFSFVNRRWREVMGYSEKEIRKIKLWNIIHPSCMAHCKDKFMDVMKGKPVKDVEAIFIRKDGGLVDVEGRAIPRLLDGKVIATQGFFMDVTESKRVEKALRESELKHRTLFENASDAIFLMRHDRFIDCNARTLVMFGCSRKQIIGAHPYDQFSTPTQPDGRSSKEESIEKINKAITEGQQFFEWRHTRWDGTPFTAEVSLNRLELGGEVLLQAIVRDVTERKMAEDEIRKFKLGIERSDQIVFMTDKDGKISYSNPSFEKIYGLKAKEIEGKTPRILKSGKQTQGFYKNLWQKLLQKKIVNVDVINKTKDHKLIDIRETANPILNEKGDIIGFIALQTDITEQKKANAALEESEIFNRRILDALPLCIKLFDNKGKIISINDYGRKEHSLEGWSDDKIREWEYLKSIEPEYHQSIKNMLKKATKGQSSSIILKHTHEHAHGGFCQSSFVPVKIKGKIQYILFSSLDVTENKKMEEVLKKSEIRYRQIFESSRDAIMLFNEKGFFGCNKATLNMFGFKTVAEFCGKHPGQLSPPTQPDGTSSMELSNKRIGDAYKNGSNYFEWVHRRKNGEDFSATVSLTVFELEGRKVIQATVRDITKQKQIENELLKKVEQMEFMGRTNIKRHKEMLELEKEVGEFRNLKNLKTPKGPSGGLKT